MPFRRPVLLLALACLLINALDCYGAWMTSAAARKCCASGHCSPTNKDLCCKNSPAGNRQTLEAKSSTSVPEPITHAMVFTVNPTESPALTQLERLQSFANGSPPLASPPPGNLPLRI